MYRATQLAVPTSRCIAGRLVIFPLLSIAAACDAGPAEPDPGAADPIDRIAHITVLYTNDEHGWIEESAEAQGAAKLRGLWRDVEKYDYGDSILVLSGGDNWTGPAVSTWFEGASTVQVMNAMGYDAAAIGNHEFDFTVDALRARIAEAEFPYLSANIRIAGSGNVPNFAIPYVMHEIAGVRVGIVGLTTVTTPYSAFPTHVADYEFIPYADALQEWVPAIWDAGAQVILLIGHICRNEMLDLVSLANELGISMLGGGHCHQVLAEIHDGVALVQGGWQMAHYAKVQIVFDRVDAIVRNVIPSYAVNEGGTVDAEVGAVVRQWEDAAADELGVTVGYVVQAIDRHAPSMHNLVTDSWLYAYPMADIAMTNVGGIRQSIPAGNITRGTIVGVLPFQNNLVALELTGSEVVGCLRNLLVAGMTAVGGYFHPDGTPLKADSVYNVLTTDYLYARSDHCFQTVDDSPYYTGLNYHQPTIDYIASLGTAPSAPLDTYLDPIARR